MRGSAGNTWSQERWVGAGWRIAAACSLTLALAASSAGAQPVAPQGRGSSSNSEMLLADEQTVLTVSKAVQKISDAPAAVTVITEEQIRASGAATLLDVLRYGAGIDVSEQNASAANVSIRGFNSQYANKLLVMVDGRSIYEAFFGGVLWHINPLLLSRIKRIEIVRGPGSALYGANAFNGVINIIMKTAAELAAIPDKTTLRLFTGEHNTQLDEAQVTVGDTKGVSASLGLAYNHTDGFGGKGQRALHDSYTAPIVTFDLEKQLPQGSLRFAAGTSNAVTDLTETIDLEGLHSHVSFLSLTYAEDRAPNPLLARIYSNFSTQNAQGVNYSNTKTTDAEVQQSRRISTQHNLIYGGSFRFIGSFSNLTGPRNHDQNLFALYLQDDWHLAEPTHLFAGLRFDRHSVYGANISPRLSLVHHLPAAQTLRAAFGTAFRAPVLNESYADQTLPTGPSTTLHLIGSTRLKPEQVINYEVGYRKELQQGYLGASFFYNKISDLIGFKPIAFLPSPPAPPFSVSQVETANLGNASAFGFELEAEKQIGKRLRALANYAYQDIRYNSHNSLSFIVPKHKVNISADWNFANHWNAFVGAHFVGATDVFSGQKRSTLDAYVRADARLSYRFGTTARPWSLSVNVTNLFDDRHYEYPNFTPGSPIQEAGAQRRTVYIGLQGGF